MIIYDYLTKFSKCQFNWQTLKFEKFYLLFKVYMWMCMFESIENFQMILNVSKFFKKFQTQIQMH